MGDVAFIAKLLTESVLNQIGDRFAIINVVWCERHIESFTSISDNQIQIETEEPTRRKLTLLGETDKYLLLLDTQVVTHDQGW